MKKTHKKNFNHLNKHGTYRYRQDSIETDYVNGVKDSSGKQVMRPLTNDEKAFLSQFYAESQLNFAKTDELKLEQKNLRNLQRKHRQYLKDTGLDHPEIQEQKSKMEVLREEAGYLHYEERDIKALTKDDNDRKIDLYTIARSNGALVNFDLDNYDRFTSEALDCADGEDVSLYQMDVKKSR